MLVNTKRGELPPHLMLTYTFFHTKTRSDKISLVINVKTFLPVIVLDILRIESIEQNIAIKAFGILRQSQICNKVTLIFIFSEIVSDMEMKSDFYGLSVKPSPSTCFNVDLLSSTIDSCMICSCQLLA